MRINRRNLWDDGENFCAAYVGNFFADDIQNYIVMSYRVGQIKIVIVKAVEFGESMILDIF